MKILITGASGFIGSHIAEEALRRGMEVWCAVRATTSRRYLSDPRLNFIELNLGNAEQLAQKLSSLQPDVIVHAAGATKCLNKSDFFRTNTEGTINLADAAVALAKQGVLQRFVFVSSLSVFGAVREEQPYTEILATDTPQPNTAYGLSKLQAERYLEKLRGVLPWVTLRPTGVYGPREKDYFLMVKSIKQHSDFAVGYKPQDITFVYVDDVVQAVFRAIDAPAEVCVGNAYFLSDGEVYRSETFSDFIHEELGRPWMIRIKAPIWLLRIITCCGEWLGHLTGTVTALNNDKYHILKQRNWRCDITPARTDLGYEPQVKLQEGTRRTVAWYKKEGWV